MFQKKSRLKMEQCWAVGFSILEISKFIMQSLYYKKVQPALGLGNVSVVLSDTDSFVLLTNYASEKEVLRRLADVMDFSNLSPTDELFDDSRAKQPGYLKSEIPKGVIEEVVALKSKTYSLRVRKLEGKEEVEQINRGKGIVETVKKKLPFESYLNCLDRTSAFEVTQHQLRSTKHTNLLIRTTKVAFSSFDDKRYLCCSIHSVPHGSRLAKSGRCYFCLYPNDLI